MRLWSWRRSSPVATGCRPTRGFRRRSPVVAQGLILFGAALVFAARQRRAAPHRSAQFGAVGDGAVVNPTELGFWAMLLAGAVRLATPVVLAALGETLVERSGIVNLGVEGMMALGAFAGVFGASEAGWGVGWCWVPWPERCSASYGHRSLKGGVNQIVVGIAVALLGTGLANYLFQIWQPSGRSAVIVPLVPTLRCLCSTGCR